MQVKENPAHSSFHSPSLWETALVMTEIHLLISRTNFHGHKDVRATEVRLYMTYIIFRFLWDHWAHCGIVENGILLMCTLEGVGGVAGFITAYKKSIKPRLPFSNPWCVLCFQRQSFWHLFYSLFIIQTVIHSELNTRSLSISFFLFFRFFCLLFSSWVWNSHISGLPPKSLIRDT